MRDILDDVIKGISEADLIVADLSGGNENVFYELGIAHALNKRTILLTDNLDNVPFDLQSYRMIGYSTHFAKIHDAKSQLSDLAKGAFENKVPFSNPVKDFYLKNPNTDTLAEKYFEQPSIEPSQIADSENPVEKKHFMITSQTSKKAWILLVCF